jgi:hypothetical protein
MASSSTWNLSAPWHANIGAIRNCFQYRPLGTLAFLSHEQQERRDLFGAKRAGATWLHSFSEQESWIQLVRG